MQSLVGLLMMIAGGLLVFLAITAITGPVSIIVSMVGGFTFGSGIANFFIGLADLY